MGGGVAAPLEAIATLRRRLAALPSRHPERQALLASTAGIYNVSRATLYRLLRGHRRPKDARGADRGQPRVMAAAELERWCEIVSDGLRAMCSWERFGAHAQSVEPSARPFVGPDRFHELTFATALAARHAIADEVRLPPARPRRAGRRPRACFGAASLDAIAARAGMTKGAIYSNFASKAELIVEALQRQGLTLQPQSEPPASLSQVVGQYAQGVAAMVRSASTRSGNLADFPLQALADPDVRAGLTGIYAASFAATAARLEGLPDVPSGVSAREVAVALQSLSMGLLVQARLTPDEVTPEVVRLSFEGLLRGLVRTISGA